jgi:hypothetical protein
MPKAVKVGISGDQVVVTSTMTLTDLLLVKKHRPDALCLKDKDGNETFRVGVGSNSISRNGVSYADETHHGSGLATASAVIPKGTKDAKEYIVDTHGLAIANLNKVESGLTNVISEINKARSDLRESIVTMGEEDEE